MCSSVVVRPTTSVAIERLAIYFFFDTDLVYTCAASCAEDEDRIVSTPEPKSKLSTCPML